MRPTLLWADPGLPPRREDDVKATVYSMAFNPSGTELVVAVANLVLVYATDDGDLRHRCDLGVPRCRGAFTPSTRLVSRNDGSGWFLF